MEDGTVGWALDWTASKGTQLYCVCDLGGRQVSLLPQSLVSLLMNQEANAHFPRLMLGQGGLREWASYIKQPFSTQGYIYDLFLI